MTEPTTSERTVPLVEGLFTAPATDGTTRLLASRCTACGETFFPPRSICAACSHRSLAPAELGPQGTLRTYTIVRDGGGRPDFRPFAVAQVDFGLVRAQGPLDVDDYARIAFDMAVEAYVRPVGKTDDGAVQVSYAFRPKA